jgi:hypothetical protein
MKYRVEKGLSHLELIIPNLRYGGIVKYLELYKTDKWYASIVIDVKEQQESVAKDNLGTTPNITITPTKRYTNGSLPR